MEPAGILIMYVKYLVLIPAAEMELALIGILIVWYGRLINDFIILTKKKLNSYLPGMDPPINDFITSPKKKTRL